MQERDKIHSIAERIKSGLIQAKWTGIEGSVGTDLGELEDLMNKLVRQGLSTLNRYDIQDIIKAFRNKVIKNRGGLFTDDELIDKGEVDFIGPCDDMISEFLTSLNVGESEKLSSLNQISTQDYVSKSRINDLTSLSGDNFDTSKLIRLCEELNIAYNNQCYYSVGFLVRIIKDHIPPIFGKESFAQVAANVGNKSIKGSLQHLENSLKNIADDMAHGHISRKEVPPNEQTVSFQADIDVLLGLIIKQLSK